VRVRRIAGRYERRDVVITGLRYVFADQVSHLAEIDKKIADVYQPRCRVRTKTGDLDTAAAEVVAGRIIEAGRL